MTDKEVAIKIAVIDLRQKILRKLRGTVVGEILCQTRAIGSTESSAYSIYLGSNYEYLVLAYQNNAIVMNNTFLDRSPETREIKSELEKFLREYLPEIEIKYKGKCIKKIGSDYRLIKNNKLGKDRPMFKYYRLSRFNEIGTYDDIVEYNSYYVTSYQDIPF